MKMKRLTLIVSLVSTFPVYGDDGQNNLEKPLLEKGRRMEEKSNIQHGTMRKLMVRMSSPMSEIHAAMGNLYNSHITGGFFLVTNQIKVVTT